MSDKEREARIMVAGVAFIRYFNELRESMERFPLEFVDAYVAVIQKQPAPNQESLAQREFMLDNIMAYREFLVNVKTIAENAQRAGLFGSEDADVSKRILSFGFGEGSDLKQ